MNPTTANTNYELLKNNCAFVNKGITAPVGEVLHGFTRYDVKFLRSLKGHSLNGMRDCKTSRRFSTILLKMFLHSSALVCSNVRRPESDRASD